MASCKWLSSRSPPEAAWERNLSRNKGRLEFLLSLLLSLRVLCEATLLNPTTQYSFLTKISLRLSLPDKRQDRLAADSPGGARGLPRVPSGTQREGSAAHPLPDSLLHVNYDQMSCKFKIHGNAVLFNVALLPVVRDI